MVMTMAIAVKVVTNDHGIYSSLYNMVKMGKRSRTHVLDSLVELFKQDVCVRLSTSHIRVCC
jgi:hypothetical protein